VVGRASLLPADSCPSPANIVAGMDLRGMAMSEDERHEFDIGPAAEMSLASRRHGTGHVGR
jgi:hypothetical protein